MPGTLAAMAGRWGSAPILGWLGLYLHVVFGLSLYMASPPVSRAGYGNKLVTPLVYRLGYKSELLIWWLRAPKAKAVRPPQGLLLEMAQHPFYLIQVAKASHRASPDSIG